MSRIEYIDTLDYSSAWQLERIYDSYDRGIERASETFKELLECEKKILELTVRIPMDQYNKYKGPSYWAKIEDVNKSRLRDRENGIYKTQLEYDLIKKQILLAHLIRYNGFK